MRKILLVAAPAIAVAQTLQPPYAVPAFASLSGDTWPSDNAWASLNSSVNGRLHALRPWAAVCYTSDPLYNPDECNSVLSNYTNDKQREAVPGALLWTNWEACSYDQGCALNYTDPQPIDSSTCYQGSIPPYSISILDAKDASTVVKWATAHNVKITVRNTGHDYQGRSAAPSSLQVNTHLMDNLTYVAKFVPKGSSAGPVPALTMGAGAQIYNIYAYAEAQNISVVAGSCLTVGAAGGYIQGGGHGVLSPLYGLAVDSALEFEVVTADGEIRVVNEAQNSDLFWALRGGGAGSWGIIISATVRAYPSVAIGASLLTIIPNASQNATALGIEFTSFMSKYQNWFINTGIASLLVLTQDQYSLFLYWPVSAADLSELYPFFEELKSLSSNYTVTSNTTSAAMFPSVSAVNLQGIGPLFEAADRYGASDQLASRLVPKSYVDPSNPSSITSVSEAIWSGLQIVNEPLLSGPPGVFGTSPVFLLGNMPARTSKLVNTTGANPGLYAAAWHVVYPLDWTLGLDAATTAKVTAAIHDAVSPLNALGIKSSYQNEGDAFEANWQEAFFGYKYTKLSAIKQKYDPKNFFTSYKGVDFVTNLSNYECYAKKESVFL